MSLNIPGYTLNDLPLYESAHTRILLGKRDEDKQPIAIKLLREDYPSPFDIARFKFEYEVTNSFSHSQIIKAYGMEKVQNRYVLILEYVPGETLAQIVKEGKLSLQEFLDVAIKISEIIGEIHRHQVIHNDINPSNIFYNRENQEIKIIDFGLSVTLKVDWAPIINPNVIIGTLPYISPEQTGRMNREIDYRTDFYSLGATLYQLLTGQLPFLSEDPMELIHSHIAIVPTPPHEVDTTIPKAISEIVMKLLAKNPDERYLNANGLIADLKNCREQLDRHGMITPFILGSKDLFNRFQIPEKLYGREKELKTLMETFERVMEGKTELMLVKGYSGIGKSALVHEIQRPIVNKWGNFVSGKFDQFKLNIPYSAFTQAFSDLVNQILTESESKIALFREKILAAIKGNGQILIDLIPNLALIIGKQPAIMALDPTESQNRLSVVFQNFISVLASEDHPLCIFLDDLQWADLPSLKMIEILLTSNCQYLLIIGAYRSNEVANAHPLIITLDNLKKNDIVCESIELGPLQLTNVNDLIADTLHQNKEAITELSEVIYKKTEGNPFFLIQVLETLYNEQLILFDDLTKQWKWDFAEIKKKKITDNVVYLLIDKIKQIPLTTQRVLQIAACIGNKFNLEILSITAKVGYEEIFPILQTIMKEGFIVRYGEVHNIPSYQFVHDRVQQAAHLMLNEEERRVIHLNIARLLLQNSEHTLKDDIFDIVNHYNIALDLNNPEQLSQNEKTHIAEINLQAARLAKSAAAYEPALRYAEASIKWQDKDGWISNYPLMFGAYAEATENAFLSSQFNLMEKYSTDSLTHVKDILDEIRIFNIKIQYLNTQLNFKDSLEKAIIILSKLGVKMNSSPSKLKIFYETLKVKMLLRGKKVQDLINLPPMKNPHKEAALLILNRIAGTAYSFNSNFYHLIICKAAQLSLIYGNSMLSPTSYSGYGILCCSLLNEFQNGYEFGQLGFKLMEKMNSQALRTFIISINWGHIYHWKEPIRVILSTLLDNFERGLNSGELEYCFYNLRFYTSYSIFAGEPLQDLLRKTESYKLFAKTKKHEMTFYAIASMQQTILNLIDVNYSHYILKDLAFDETSLPYSKLPTPTLFNIFIFKLQLSCIFEEYSLIDKLIKQGNLLQNSFRSLYGFPNYNFYKSLALLAIYPSSSPEKKREIKKTIKSNQKQMKKWIDFSPVNHAQKYYLIEAERTSKILEQPEKAVPLYNEAIVWASKNEHIHEEALANERLAELYLAMGNEKVAKIYLLGARHAYLLWGADGKVAQLDMKYGRLIEQRILTSGTTTSVSTTTSTGHTMSTSLDIGTIQKCSQTISSTIVLNDLLKNLMHLVIENAGAERSFFILGKERKFLIEAEGNVKEKEASILQSIEITDAILPTSILNFVINTHESVVLDNAVHSDRFAKDPYIVKNHPKSVLCIPLLNQGALTGLLYLENNLAPGAFTKDRIDLLNLISSQIAISIDNARLYADTVSLNEHLVALNTSYERFVPKDFLGLLQKKTITEVALGDHIERKMSVLFTDIRDFTARSEKMTPEENFNFINGFLNLIAPIITKHRGFIDKYIGDAIMALYPEDADDALQCALEIQKILNDYNAQQPNQEPIKIGIGINTGMLMLGTVGEKNRLGATVISDSVNIAARVESLTKVYNEEILITENTYKDLKDSNKYKIEKVADTLVKGKSEKVTIYKVSD